MQGAWQQNSNSTESLTYPNLCHCEPNFLSLDRRGLRHVLSQSPEPFAFCHSEVEKRPKNLAQGKLRAEAAGGGQRRIR